MHERQTPSARDFRHRVKNDLQVITSLLRLQGRRARSEEAARMLSASIRRVRCIAIAYDQLSARGPELAVDARRYLEHVLSEVVRAGSCEARITHEYRLDTVRLPMTHAVPCGLIAAELVSNCLEHGFVGRATGRVIVELVAGPAECHLTVGDDGVGGLPSAENETGAFGLSLVRMLASQLEGTIEVRSGEDGGTEVGIRFAFPTGCGVSTGEAD